MSEIKKVCYKVLINSLNTQQINYLGEQIDQNFNLYKESGINQRIPIPRQTAAETLLYYFKEDEDVVRIFTYMLMSEGKRFYNRDLIIWGKNELIAILEKNKWIFDDDLKLFFLDPFYENEINFLKKIRLIDLRTDIQIDSIINEIAAISTKMSIKDIEWRISLRLYDIDPKISELIREIITLLLSQQNLQVYSSDLFISLKELAINASKANYKLLFEKHVTSKRGITAERDYIHFLQLFKEEIEKNGNSRLLELAKANDKFITITFQSSINSIEIWVTNNQNISPIEKKQLLGKLYPRDRNSFSISNIEDKHTEGAGLGLNITLNALKKYCKEKDPLKIIFYPDFIKIGFKIEKSELINKTTV